MDAAFLLRAAALCWMVSIAFVPAASGQPVADRVLQNADVIERDGCSIIRVEFNFPVQYISHFPPDAGDELIIQFRPIVTNTEQRESLLVREAARPPGNNDLGILSIVYDGELSSGPVLTVEFRRPLSFSVGQGSDYRSLLIAVPGPDRTSPCL